MTLFKNQRGFSPLIVALVLVVLAGLGGAGYYVWDKNKDTDKKDNTSQNNKDGEDPQGEEPADPSEGGKYLVIKEWGTRIPLTERIKGAYYTYEKDDLNDSVLLYDSGFNGLKNKYGVSCGGENTYLFYAISRAKPENVSELSYGSQPQYKYFSFTEEYMFGGLGAHQAPPNCALSNPGETDSQQEDTNIYDVADKKEQAFEQAFEHLETIPESE